VIDYSATMEEMDFNLFYFPAYRDFFHCGLGTLCILYSLQARCDAPILSSRKLIFYASLSYVIQF
jgi:hypothetical protein